MRLYQALSCSLLTATFWLSQTSAQTYSNCNPLYTSGCPPNSALGKSVSIDFTKGASDSFTSQGNPTYGSSGASFTVSRSGDSPQINSRWYIMFGRVSVVMKAASGAGIVSSFVLQSDDLDELDWEWLGAAPDEVQTNYFGKGQTTTYNRGAFHSDSGSQSGFKTYTIEWTAEQISWSINGNIVRVLTPSTAEANQYPQTPMMVKIGAWSGGDPSNAQGTINWAKGPTDYSKGPFTMTVASVSVQDYSTGTQYSYTGNSGSWKDIRAVGGSVNPSGNGAAVVVATTPEITATASGPPAPLNGIRTLYTTPTVYPWVPYTGRSTTGATPAYTNYPGLPSGWTVSDSGKVIPPSEAPALHAVPLGLLGLILATFTGISIIVSNL